MTARAVPDDEAGRGEAIDVLAAGGIVALPTDTVYGIAVALSTTGGIERLFAAKRRPPDKGIMLLLDDAAQAATAGAMTPAASALAAAFWPGGLTVIVPQRPDVPWPAVLTGGARTIGLRVPDHPAPRALAAGVGPLPTTSANVSGIAEASDAAAILDQLGGSVDLILDWRTGARRPGFHDRRLHRADTHDPSGWCYPRHRGRHGVGRGRCRTPSPRRGRRRG
jgi:L-threonylcarbamoyladenylate synthase